MEIRGGSGSCSRSKAAIYQPFPVGQEQPFFRKRAEEKCVFVIQRGGSLWDSGESRHCGLAWFAAIAWIR